MTDLIGSEEELLNAFRPRDRRHVDIPREMRFPLSLYEYLAWTEPSGVRLYLVFKEPAWKSSIGIAFRRDQHGSPTSPARMCEWCHAIGPSDQIALLTATVDSKRRVGVNLCIDLSCVAKMESIASLAGMNLGKLLERHRERMLRFCREGLGLTPGGDWADPGTYLYAVEG